MSRLRPGRLPPWRSLAMLVIAGCGPSEKTPPRSHFDTVEEFGEALFFEDALSRNRTQACATCHDPARAFTDGRRGANGQVMPVSVGDDGTSLGSRNAPSAAYALFAPDFHTGTRRRYNKQSGHRVYEGPLGGQFWDGRAIDLEQQAGGPPLNPLEMAMPHQAAVAERLYENDEYRAALFQFFGENALDDDAAAYTAMTEALAAFERTETFAPFDSRYDRSLRGEVALTFKELTGKALFFSQFASCAICHQLYSEGDPIGETRETFSGYEFHNIGVPENVALRELSGTTTLDSGLFDGDRVTDPTARGKFKTPSLRNAAVTGPYMHNGVFADLRTVIEFYDHFTNPEERTTNPETGAPWRPPEIPQTVATELLEVGDPLRDDEVEGLVCFIRALTDQRYELLLERDGIDCG